MTSSSSSLRRCQLGEITEDAEVEESASIADRSVAASSYYADVRRGSVYSRTSDSTAVPDYPRRPGSRAASVADTASIRSRGYSQYNADKPLPSIPRDQPRSRANGLAQKHLLNQLSQPMNEPRNSTQSLRPSTRDLDQASLHRPKVKLGPRPAAMDVNGRPRTAGSMGRSRETRPVAALPAGIRLTTRKTNASRPKSQPDLMPPTTHVPPVPALLPPPPIIGSFSRNAPASPRSIKSVASSIGVTPEKQRLMKALELRKKQMEKQAQIVESRKQEEETEIAKQVEVKNSATALKIPDVKSECPEETVEDNAPVKAESSLEPSQSDEEYTAGILDEIKDPVADLSKQDSAVDLSIGEQCSRRDDLLAPVVPSVAEEPASPVVSLIVHTPDTEVTEPLKTCDRESSPLAEGPEPNQQVENVSTPSDSAVPQISNEQSAINPCEIEIPSDVQCLDTPTPRAIPREMLEDLKVESEIHKPSVQKEEVTNSNAETPIPTADSPQLDQANNDAKSERDVDTYSDDEKNKKDRKHKRRAMLDPIHIPQRLDDLDEDNLLSDDSFMEELKSATVEEAKPIAVPKTPLTPFSGNGDIASSDRWKGSRLVSNASAGGLDVQALPVGRSASGSYFNTPTAVPVLVAKKVNVSSGISKRIKALEKFSSRESGANNVPVISSSASSSPFEKFRKRASMTPSSIHSPGTPKSTKSHLTQESTTPVPKRHDSLSPTASIKGKTNSVSVTARIIRDPSAPPPDPKADPSEPNIMNLQRSELIVEHDGDGATTATMPPMSPSLTPAKQEKKRWSISSVSSKHAPEPSSVRRSDSISSKMSVSSRSKVDGVMSRSSIDTHHLESVDEVLEGKKESRKSRLMRRMSTITSNSRRGIINALSPTLKEEGPPSPLPAEEEIPESPQVVDIGEVNVQFPDTLLWKRRFMRVDDRGYLVLTPGTIDGTSRNIVKRYHLSEFRAPTLPDQDRQELPNSIVLDFKNGSTLQCACESRNGQRAILQSKYESRE